MAYLPPPPAPTPMGRRPPRWSRPELQSMVDAWVDGDLLGGRRMRRHLGPVLLRLAEAGLDGRRGRQAIAQTAVSAALASLSSGTTPPDATETAFRAVAHVIEATGHPLPDLPALSLADRAIVRVVELELADPDRIAHAFAVPSIGLVRARGAIARRLTLNVLRESTCHGWAGVRRELRDDDMGGRSHRERCGKCALVAELVTARRRRLWPVDTPGGPFAQVFDPRL